MSIKRYSNDHGIPCQHETPYGDYVKYEDYEREMLRLRDAMRAVYLTTRFNNVTGNIDSTPQTYHAHERITEILRENGFETGYRASDFPEPDAGE